MRAWSHAVMLLLGITLTVGFYEGRRLVKNTMRALQVGDSTPGLAVRLDPAVTDDRAEDGRRGRSGARKSTRGTDPAVPRDEDRMDLRERMRVRASETDRAPSAGMARAPRGPSDPMDQDLALPADPLLEDDTGEPAP